MAPRRLIPLLALGLLFIAHHSAAAANPFRFSSETREFVPLSEFGATNLSIRPNNALTTNLYVENATDDDHMVLVQLVDSTGKVVADARLNAAKKAYSRVKLAKPGPPIPPAGAAPMPMPPPMPMPVPPVPPGVELKLFNVAQHTFAFKLLHYDIDKIMKDPVESKKKPELWTPTDTQTVVVTVRQPSDYVTMVGNPLYSKDAESSQLILEVKTEENFDPPCVVELQFPLQKNLNVDSLRAGVYRRALTTKGQTAKLESTDLPIRNVSTEKGTFYLTIDGVPRTYVFTHAWQQAAKSVQVTTKPDLGARLIEDGKRESNPIVSLPKEKVNVRVEVDNPGQNTILDLRLKPAGKNEVVATFQRIGMRNEQVWLDPAAPEGALMLTTRVGDWVVPVDTRDLRGRFTLEAALRESAATKTERPQPSLTLVLDDTVPEVVRIDTLPDKQFRGRPMPVSIFARDPESEIAKVAVFIGRPGPDGKLPEGAVLVEAARPKVDGGAWVAQLPIAPDQKAAKVPLTGVATNGVGLTATVTQIVQLYDPPTGGTIKGAVKLGQFGKNQEGVSVLLKDADGKDKASAKTGKKGEFIIEDVPPGSYKVIAARADAGVGTRGEETVKVEAGKTSNVLITLSRKPMP